MLTHFNIFVSAVFCFGIITTKIDASNMFIYNPYLNLHDLAIPISKQRLTLSLVDNFIRKYSGDKPHFRGFYENYFETLISQAQAIADDENSSWPQLEHAAAGLSLILKGHPSSEQRAIASACRQQLAPRVENLLEKAIRDRSLTKSYIEPALFIVGGSPELFEKLDTAHRQSFFDEAARIIEAETTTWDEIEHAIMGLAFCRVGREQLGKAGESESTYLMEQQIRAVSTTIVVKYKDLIKKTMAESIIYGSSLRALERGLCIHNVVGNALTHIQDKRVEDEHARGVKLDLFAKVPPLEKELSSIIGSSGPVLGNRQYAIDVDYWNDIDRPQNKALTRTASATRMGDTIVLQNAPGTITVVTTFKDSGSSSVVIDKVRECGAGEAPSEAIGIE